MEPGNGRGGLTRAREDEDGDAEETEDDALATRARDETFRLGRQDALEAKGYAQALNQVGR